MASPNKEEKADKEEVQDEQIKVPGA